MQAWPVARRILVFIGTLAALALVVLVLVAPRLDRFHPLDLIGIPIELVVFGGLLLVLPQRWARRAAYVFGPLLALAAVFSLLDAGFRKTLARPFDLAFDWELLPGALSVVSRDSGRLGAIGVAVGAVLLTLVLTVLLTLSVRRLTNAGRGHRRLSAGLLAVLGVGWLVTALLGTELVHAPLASRGAADLLGYNAVRVLNGVHDRHVFGDQLQQDPFAAVPDDQLLQGLRGKDVMLTFVEAYGRLAVEDPQVRALLDRGTADLTAAGFSARSGWLHSSTFGGSSWLAHATLQSGSWVSNQGRFRLLSSSDRLTLSGAFRDAGWRTVCVTPATTEDWPEGDFYRFQQVYDVRNLGYRGRRYGYSTMPDQYAFAKLQAAERGPGHAPVMVEMDLTSSHFPWRAWPQPVGWDVAGDGAVFTAQKPTERSGNARADYLNSIKYTLTTVLSYLQTYGDDNLVMVFLGDHQPAASAAGDDRRREVPITIVAKDPKVLERISSWGWTPGLAPGPDAQVLGMDRFRDRFLTAFTD
jgi:hypothetical protein